MWPHTIEISNSEIKIKSSKSDGKIIFELPETELKLLVLMPN